MLNKLCHKKKKKVAAEIVKQLSAKIAAKRKQTYLNTFRQKLKLSTSAAEEKNANTLKNKGN